ncbi:hypothetical protein OHS70_11660 [Streptomyces sp. NBC_00390]|uniref:hypothetical protein n=1 Tax=Streptomyces sp. NBC_00390 TaxID=2975736 RepID=UPI002E1E0582
MATEDEVLVVVPPVPEAVAEPAEHEVEEVASDGGVPVSVVVASRAVVDLGGG